MLRLRAASTRHESVPDVCWQACSDAFGWSKSVEDILDEEIEQAEVIFHGGCNQQVLKPGLDPIKDFDECEYPSAE